MLVSKYDMIDHGKSVRTGICQMFYVFCSAETVQIRFIDVACVKECEKNNVKRVMRLPPDVERSFAFHFLLEKVRQKF